MLNLPRNIYLISLVMSLNFTLISMMVLVSGLLGAAIAPDPKLATLPVASLVVGTASASIPAAMIMQRVGRKAGMAIGLGLALLGTLTACYSAMTENFWLFLVGTLCIGFNAAFTQQGRFIIIENANNEAQQADGLTLALLANLFAAIIGPWMGAIGKDLIVSPVGYAGSFLLASGVLLLSLLVLTQFNNLPALSEQPSGSGRPLREIASQPVFIVAAGVAAIGYAVMSLVMTATPISMVAISGHSLEHTRFVIQTHIVAMFLPSIITGQLLKRGLRSSLLFAGLSLYFAVAWVGYSGAAVMHYWWALALLGLGWNLLFLTCTTLLPRAYNEQEKFKTQALNDFIIFTVQAISAFAAGWLLFNLGWNSVITIALIATTIGLMLVVWLARPKLPHMSTTPD